MNNTICQPIVNYNGDGIYYPIKDKGIWVDQCGQQIRKNFKINVKCPCRQYLNDNCGTNYKSNLTYETPDINYFIQKHIKTNHHKKMITHMNEVTSSLENKSTNELAERIQELERIIRKDKVDFRQYLEIKEKEFREEIKAKDEAIQAKDETIKLKDHVIELLNKKSYVPVENLLD